MNHKEVFTCIAVIEESFRDLDRRTNLGETEVQLTAHTLQELYDLIAQEKIDREYEVCQRDYAVLTVKDIRKITIVEELQFDNEMLENTDAWKEHLKKLEAEREKKRQRQEEDKLELERHEKEIFLKLKTKFGDKQ